jgi:superfamily II DNA or RNA helicase
VELRDYQQDSITMVRNSLAQGNKRVIIDLATGGGKSLICESIIQGALSKGKKVMFLVNRVQLADQMSDHLSRAKIQHGVLQGANTRGAYHDCVIASIDTIHARGYPDVDLILADEIHGAAGSKKYIKLIEHYKDIPIVGVTATSFVKGLGKTYEFGQLFQDVVRAITIPELIEQGYLVDVDIYAPSDPDLKGVKIPERYTKE